MNHQSPLVYLIDDDEAVREALAFLIRTVGLRVEAFAESAHFLSAFERDAIGCLILDVRMPGMGGLQVQELLAAQGVDLPVIVITGHGDLELCRRAFKAGAVEFLTKPIDEHALLEAVQKAVRAHILSRARLAASRQARERLERLSERERDVLGLIVDGLSNKQIAQRLGLSPRTVETHRANLFAKLEAGSLAELIRLYLAQLGAA